MTSTLAERGRTIVPAKLRRQLKLEAGATLRWKLEGQVLRVEKLESAKLPRARLVRRGGRTFLDSGRPLDLAALQRELEAFP
jgi:bifunctional DNA-binding transcriptional regulator/antitoxin component of YhaV-PrlF toxin-antitoxin module